MTKKDGTFTLTFERDRDGWWVAAIREIAGCHTQGRSIAQARERIREAMELFDVDPDAVELREEIHLEGDLDHEIEQLRELRERSEKLVAESQERTKRIVSRLAKVGISRRDAGELLGLSFQRVQQIAEAGARRRGR